MPFDGTMNRPAPLDRGFNAAVLAVAARLFPTGYDVAAEAPDTLEKLREHVARTGRMLVWNGASDRTIFADEEVNFAFRAWHDWCHLQGGFAFDAEGEAQACAMQQSHLREVFGESEQTARWERILDAEVNGQIDYHLATGTFPEDQHAFAVRYLAEGASFYR